MGFQNCWGAFHRTTVQKTPPLSQPRVARQHNQKTEPKSESLMVEREVSAATPPPTVRGGEMRADWGAPRASRAMSAGGKIATLSHSREEMRGSFGRDLTRTTLSSF